MERIHNLLQKIQEIYYRNGQKEVIDIDLMLDYTRVMYADLLEARTDILAKQGMGFHLKPEVVGPSIPIVETPVVPEVVEEKIEEPIAEMPVDPAIEDLEEPVQSIEEPIVEDEVVQSEHEAEPEIIDQDELDPIGKIEDILITPEEKQQIVINDDDFPSLDFDAIHKRSQQESEPEHEIFSEISFELPDVKDHASESPKPTFTYQSKPKDIRSFIGINDKYQFMNELFANNKTAYEETLDNIVKQSNFLDAEQWLLNDIAKQQSWNIEDETVAELIAVVKKYFAA